MVAGGGRSADYLSGQRNEVHSLLLVQEEDQESDSPM